MMSTRLLRTMLACFLLDPNAISATEVMPGSSQDPSSYANVDQFQPSHMSFELSVSFEDSSTFGFVTHTLTVLEENVQTVFLDVWNGLEVLGAEFQRAMTEFEDFTQVPFEITTPNPNIGNALGVTLPVEMMAGTIFFLRLSYRTNADTTAISWMTPSQTAGKELPFMYSLCQMNFCRDLAPMMDSPSQKITYDATVVAPSGLVVGMSANETGSMALNETHTVSSFECSIRVPSYLIAIVIGDLVTSNISSRVRVMSEPSLLESAVTEFAELPDALDFIEDYLSPYIWGTYTIVIMPPSFPWGGMEHPMITFASHTLITGDKSQVDVAIHEITHSWFGNDVGCQNWDNFWLNEGLNTFMERKVTSALRGEDFAKIEYFTGNTSMYFDDMVGYYGVDSTYSSLFPDIGDADPEDSFSGVPYEKGSQFAYYIETLIGKDAMQSLLRLYLSTFAQTAITAPDFKALYESFVKATFDEAAADNILVLTDWDTWVYSPGLPPVTLSFQTAELEDAQALAQAYVDLGGKSSPNNFMTFFDFFSSQKVAFVQELDAIDSVDADLLAYIDSELKLASILDPKVKNEWFVLGIKNNYEAVMDPAYVWIGEQGRNAYVKPIYSAMVAAGNCDMAKTWFAENESFYNSYVLGGVSRQLAACDEEEGTAAPESKASLPLSTSSMFALAAAMILGINVL